MACACASMRGLRRVTQNNSDLVEGNKLRLLTGRSPSHAALNLTMHRPPSRHPRSHPVLSFLVLDT